MGRWKAKRDHPTMGLSDYGTKVRGEGGKVRGPTAQHLLDPPAGKSGRGLPHSKTLRDLPAPPSRAWGRPPGLPVVGASGPAPTARPPIELSIPASERGHSCPLLCRRAHRATTHCLSPSPAGDGWRPSLKPPRGARHSQPGSIRLSWEGPVLSQTDQETPVVSRHRYPHRSRWPPGKSAHPVLPTSTLGMHSDIRSDPGTLVQQIGCGGRALLNE
jgi:hypothetical protein